MIQMIAMDLDGTLLGAGSNVSDYSISIMQKCRNKGIKITVATARSANEADRIVNYLKPDFMILNGGGLVLDREKNILYEKIIPADISDRIIKRFINDKNFGTITMETRKGYFRNQKEPKWHPDYLTGSYNDFSESLSLESYKIVFELYREETAEEIQNEFPQISLIKFSGENWYGIYHKEAGKMPAIKAVADKENIPVQNIAAFGDDFNDMEMILKCGTGVAMENGIDEIKNIANFICKNNREDGVARWIEENIL